MTRKKTAMTTTETETETGIFEEAAKGIFEEDPSYVGHTLDFLITLWRKELIQGDMAALESIWNIISGANVSKQKFSYRVTAQIEHVAVIYEFKLKEYQHYLEIVEKMKNYYDLKHAQYLMDDPISFRISYEISYLHEGSV